MRTPERPATKSTLRRVLVCLAPLLLVIGACGGQGPSGEGGAAAEYPQKSIQLIVPWSAGGDTDAIFRLIGEGLTEELGQTVVIRNVAGGGGSVGAQQALNASNDGYTLLAGHDSIAISNLAGQTDFGYFDFEPVALMTSTYDFVAAPAASPWNSVEDMLKDAKENPGEITFGASIGSTSELEPALIQSATGVEFNIVGYKDTAARMQALAGNHVDLGGVSVVAGKEYLEAGKLKLLGYFGEERSEAVPDVPTLKEQGVDVSTATNRGVFAPKGTPDAIVEKLSAALEEVANDEEFAGTLDNLGTEVNYMDHKAYRDFLEQNATEMEEVMKKAGMI
jgi:tripartite-type tricarboxylate transporter receptor subunit TctC